MKANILGKRGGILGTWIRKLEIEFDNLLNDDKRIMDFYIKNNSDETPICFNFQLRTIAQKLQSDIFDNHPGKISRDYVNGKLRDAHYSEKESVFTLRTHYHVENGRVYIKGCTLLVSTSTLAQDICYNIYDLEYLWKLHSWLLRHEVGHFVDHILNDHGITLEESDKRSDQVEEDYKNHFEWAYEYMKQPNASYATINKAYYNIPSEARANEYAGISVDDMQKAQDDNDSNWTNKVITLDINVTGIKDLEKESDQNGDTEDFS